MVESTPHVINGKMTNINAITKDGVTYTCLKDLCAILGLKLSYDSATKERIVDFAQLKIKIDGADHAVSGGAMVPGTSYAAVRELLELLGYEVGWDAAAKAVMVKSGGTDTGSAIVSKELGE